MVGTTKRLYHFTCTKWALTAIRDRRLKGAQLDNTNDVFDLLSISRGSPKLFPGIFQMENLS